ncbi:MAG: hypothetical protein V5A27_01600 [Halapricum sp.]
MEGDADGPEHERVADRGNAEEGEGTEPRSCCRGPDPEHRDRRQDGRDEAQAEEQRPEGPVGDVEVRRRVLRGPRRVDAHQQTEEAVQAEDQLGDGRSHSIGLLAGGRHDPNSEPRDAEHELTTTTSSNTQSGSPMYSRVKPSSAYSCPTATTSNSKTGPATEYFAVDDSTTGSGSQPTDSLCKVCCVVRCMPFPRRSRPGALPASDGHRGDVPKEWPGNRGQDREPGRRGRT